MSNVWTYWKCSACGNIIRGDSRVCPACGTPIPNGVKYLMPNNPEVLHAKEQDKILTNGEVHSKFVNEQNIESELVDEEKISFQPNWTCSYCGYQNYDSQDSCENCGSSKFESKANYFGERTIPQEDPYKSFINEIKEPPLVSCCDVETHSTLGEGFSAFFRNILSLICQPKVLKIGSIIAGIIFLVWLFFPITREAKIEGFRWQRTIAIEEYKLCHESDWSVPSGGKITSQKEEIHHYDKVLDHYETKTRQVSERVLDHYDTHYKDLGNGQAKVEKTPVYKTVYHTETYEEPVYRSVPVYRTKYYYDIGRWKEVDSLITSGTDQKPYWKESTLPSSVSNPNYGDRKLGNRKEDYDVVIKDGKGRYQFVSYSYADWKQLELGQTIKYKTFRFSQKPL